jgi:Helix-turn-helix domain
MSQRDSSLSPERKAKPVPPTLDPLQRYSVAEANALLRQSNARTYQQIKAGELRTIRDGGRTYIPGSEIVRRSTLPASEAAKGST